MTAPHTESNSGFEIQRLYPSDDAYTPALRMVLHAAGPTDDPVTPFLESIGGGPAALDLVFAAQDGRGVVGACAAVTSPGHSALVLVPDHAPAEATAAVLTHQARTAWAEGVRLLEVLVTPGDKRHALVFEAAGYRRLTSLIYMRSRIDSTVFPEASSGVTWKHFSPANQPWFEQAIAESYEQSLDCPELSDLRSTQDAIAGHRATGDFDPQLWWVAIRDGSPVGLILLSKIRYRPALELVYMGVSPSSRGSGIGNALIARGFRCARTVGANTLALAVDHRNRPALRLYRRWGFIEVGLRDAWIASPSETES